MATFQIQKSRKNVAIDRLLASDNVSKDPVFVPPQLNDQTPIAVIRLKNVMARTGLSRSAVYDRIDPASKRHDKSFPVQIRLGTNGRAVGWISTEIDVWLRSQIAASRSACE